MNGHKWNLYLIIYFTLKTVFLDLAALSQIKAISEMWAITHKLLYIRGVYCFSKPFRVRKTADLNCRPTPCKSVALPTELVFHEFKRHLDLNQNLKVMRLVTLPLVDVAWYIYLVLKGLFGWQNKDLNLGRSGMSRML